MERKARPEVAVERALVAIRRRQARRTLARLAERRLGPGRDTSLSAVLDVVEEQEEAALPCTVTSVAEGLGVDPPRASKLVARAVVDGLLRRQADQGDGRRSLLALTPAGRAHQEEVHRFRREVFGRAMAGWSAAERRQFARLLTQFVAQLEALASDESPA
jgi:DNA-binding MarR family transcriptional regulator